MEVLQALDRVRGAVLHLHYGPALWPHAPSRRDWRAGGTAGVRGAVGYRDGGTPCRARRPVAPPQLLLPPLDPGARDRAGEYLRGVRGPQPAKPPLWAQEPGRGIGKASSLVRVPMDRHGFLIPGGL